MDKKTAVLELMLIKEKLARRLGTAMTLSKGAWNPKNIGLLPGERFLVISPHPDDDVIGCGGTILKALAMKKAVRICYLSLPSIHAASSEERMQEVKNALRTMGVSEYSINEREFPNNAKLIREIIEPELLNWKPDCVLVPSPLENHNEHMMTFYAYVETMRNSQCKAASALYEVWGPVIPNLIIDITDYLERKSESIAAHASQVKIVDYVAMAKALNEYRAISSNTKGYAEAFLYLEKKDLLRLFP